MPITLKTLSGGGGAYADKPTARGTTFSPPTYATLDRYPAPFGVVGDKTTMLPHPIAPVYIYISDSSAAKVKGSRGGWSKKVQK